MAAAAATAAAAAATAAAGSSNSSSSNRSFTGSAGARGFCNHGSKWQQVAASAAERGEEGSAPTGWRTCVSPEVTTTSRSPGVPLVVRTCAAHARSEEVAEEGGGAGAV